MDYGFWVGMVGSVLVGLGLWVWMVGGFENE